MNDDVVRFIGGGIKCDNPECDFADETVRVEDYKDWLNKPCPKCGSNLLTQADYDNVQMLSNLVDMVNKNPNEFIDITNKNYHLTECIQANADKDMTITFNMNGTGKMDIEINVDE